MYSLKNSTENSQKLLNFGKPKALFGSVLRAKSLAWLAFYEKVQLGSDCLIKNLGSACQKVGPEPTLTANLIYIQPLSKILVHSTYLQMTSKPWWMLINTDYHRCLIFETKEAECKIWFEHPTIDAIKTIHRLNPIGNIWKDRRVFTIS